MRLLVDAGNTKIKWALIDCAAFQTEALGRWIGSGTVDRADAGQLAEAWRGLGVSRVLLSNVAGPAMRRELEQALSRVSAPAALEWFASAPALAGVRNGYRAPGQLGCDRFAAMIGAHALVPDRPLIVATCGTATTIDALTADGLFVGGMILPGLGVMAASLARNTAQLPQVPQHIAVAATFADNTDEAIVSGCIAAQTGAIERAAAALTERFGAAQCIVSGGAASAVAPHLSLPCRLVDNLVLVGLQTVSMKQNTPC